MEEKHCDNYNNERECCGDIIHHLGRMASHCFGAPTQSDLPAEGTRTKDELRYENRFCATRSHSRNYLTQIYTN